MAQQALTLTPCYPKKFPAIAKNARWLRARGQRASTTRVRSASSRSRDHSPLSASPLSENSRGSSTARQHRSPSSSLIDGRGSSFSCASTGRHFDYDGAPYAIAEYSDASAPVLDLRRSRGLFDPNGKPFDSSGKTQTHYIARPSLATRNRITSVDDVPFFVTPAGLLEAHASLVALRRRLRKYA